MPRKGNVKGKSLNRRLRLLLKVTLRSVTDGAKWNLFPSSLTSAWRLVRLREQQVCTYSVGAIVLSKQLRIASRQVMVLQPVFG
jgi:hypothetical protein